MLTGYLYVIIPKGFFPQEDTGADRRHYRGRAGHLVRRRMSERQQALVNAMITDPDIASIASYIGPGGRPRP